jgi:hypothetical protein
MSAANLDRQRGLGGLCPLAGYQKVQKIGEFANESRFFRSDRIVIDSLRDSGLR